MTNREYMESLSDEDLAKFLDDEPWNDYCFEMSFEWGEAYITAFVEWLNQEKE